MSLSQPEIVNPVEVDEGPPWLRAMVSGFLEDPRSPSVERWARVLARVWERERVWGARDRGRWVGTLRTEERTLTVPGRDGATRTLPADAVTCVTVSGPIAAAD